MIFSNVCQGLLMRFVTLLSLVLLVFLSSPASAESGFFLNASAEDERQLPREIVPTQEVVVQILNSLDDREHSIEYLDACMEDQNISKSSYREMFRASLLPGLRTTPVYFVRPALKPYCGVFYGANSMQFWLVNDGGILLALNATSVSIMLTGNDGMPDIAVLKCKALSCNQTQLQYNAGTYRPVVCARVDFLKDGSERKRSVRCKKENQ